ncbi:MAG: MFS transporter [Candidatus Paracaedibacteraceae bacterium]|nr:MFS transporter [Candidatus Paracaedibacteraceae bacterium]
MKKSSFLTKDQRESLGLINIGTLLEYFDFYTYIHIAVVLNSVFFPTSDPYTKSLLMALSFSMAYVLRPLGSLVFGFLGDLWGRKVTIIITTLMMSISSFTLGCMPTFEQIGWTASITVLICRAIQGMSSAVEVIGARIYTCEMLKAPKSYFYTALISVASDLGTILALGMCSLMLFIHPEDGWRYVFLLGSGIAVVGSIARTRLKESPEFLKAIKKINKNNRKQSILKTFSQSQKNVIAYFFIEFRTPILFFISFIQLGEFLSTNYGYTPTQIIHHNLFITMLSATVYIISAFLTQYIFPIKIMKFSAFALLLFSFFFPFLINHAHSVGEVFLIQSVPWALNITGIGAAIFMRGFPVIGRYTIIGVSYSLARALGAVTTSYACVWLAAKFGPVGMAGLMGFTVLLHIIGLYHFTPNKEDNYFEKPLKNYFWRKTKLEPEAPGVDAL